MNRIAKVAGPCLFGLLALTVPVGAQANVAGSWTLAFDSPEYPAELSVVLAQDGNIVTGAVEVPMFEATEVSDGLVEENRLTLLFRFRVSVDAPWFTLEVEAEVDGDTMEGSVYMAEMGTFPFRAKRAAGG